MQRLHKCYLVAQIKHAVSSSIYLAYDFFLWRALSTAEVASVFTLLKTCPYNLFGVDASAEYFGVAEVLLLLVDKGPLIFKVWFINIGKIVKDLICRFHCHKVSERLPAFFLKNYSIPF